MGNQAHSGAHANHPRVGGSKLTLTKHLLVDKHTRMLFSNDLLFADGSGASWSISCNTSASDQPGSPQGSSPGGGAPSRAEAAYLSEGQHLLWSTLQGHGDLSQVGAALPEEALLLGAAGRSPQRQPASQRLHPALDLQASGSPRTQISHTHTQECVHQQSADVKVGSVDGTPEGVCCRFARNL